MVKIFQKKMTLKPVVRTRHTVVKQNYIVCDCLEFSGHLIRSLTL